MLVGAVSGPARRKLIKCERAPDVFFSRKRNLLVNACATDKFVTSLRKIREGRVAEGRGLDREKEKRDEKSS
jgi:hypothetical protein